MKKYSSLFLSEVKREEIWRKYRSKRNFILVVSVLIVGVLYAFKNVSTIARVASAIGLLIVFYFVDHLFDLDFKKSHYFFILVIFVSGFLFSPLYYIYSSYDKILHLVMPMMFASIAFHMVNRLKLERKWKLVFVFFLIVGSVGMFEIGEYLLDYFFDLKLQGVFLQNLQGLQRFDILLDRIDDTMIDMFLGIVGTLAYVGSIGFFSKKKFS